MRVGDRSPEVGWQRQLFVRGVMNGWLSLVRDKVKRGSVDFTVCENFEVEAVSTSAMISTMLRKSPVTMWENPRTYSSCQGVSQE